MTTCEYGSGESDEEIELRRYEEEQDALADYREAMDSGEFDRDPRDYD